MGLTKVTISIEEFKDLVKNKRKIQEILTLVKDNEDYNLIPATAKMLVLSSLEKWDESIEVATKADELNLETLKKIKIILER